MKDVTVIGLSGKKGSGKSAVRKFLLHNADALFGPGTKAACFPMAGPLKKFCVEVLGLAPEQVYGTDGQKNTPTRYRWEDLPHYDVIKSRLWDEVQKKYERATELWLDNKYWPTVEKEYRERTPQGFMTAREVLQEVGTGVFRKMWEDVWVAANLRDVEASGAGVAVIDDVRFPNEVAGTLGHGVVYRLPRDVSKGDKHASEVALDPDRFDWAKFTAVVGDGTLPLRETCTAVCVALWYRGLLAGGTPPEKFSSLTIPEDA